MPQPHRRKLATRKRRKGGDGKVKNGRVTACYASLGLRPSPRKCDKMLEALENHLQCAATTAVGAAASRTCAQSLTEPPPPLSLTESARLRRHAASDEATRRALQYASDSPVRRLQRASRYVTHNTSCTQRVRVNLRDTVYTICCLEGVTRARDIIKAMQPNCRPGYRIVALEVRDGAATTDDGDDFGGSPNSGRLPGEPLRLRGEQLMSCYCGDARLEAVCKKKATAFSQTHLRFR